MSKFNVNDILKNYRKWKKQNISVCCKCDMGLISSSVIKNGQSYCLNCAKNEGFIR